ncbi:MAG TPA: riboflavin biosynthesis protein RibD, partial [Ruminococcaceae bacterium]|nr:riboflavin biosynthesis protein RibD [Oscillospiraceae bacterium]
MRAALELAKQGCGKVDPNPLVGAILVKDGKVIGKGFHQKYGGLHAERNALAD